MDDFFLIKGETLEATANSIRSYLQDVVVSNDGISPTDFPNKIGEVYNAGIEAGGAELTLQSKTVSPSSSTQTIIADSGYSGLSSVTVQACSGTRTITSTSATNVVGYRYAIVSDSDLVASNIRDGVSILGVTGTYTGSSTTKYEIAIYNSARFFSFEYYCDGHLCTGITAPYDDYDTTTIFWADANTTITIMSVLDVTIEGDFDFGDYDQEDDCTFTVTKSGIVNILSA